MSPPRITSSTADADGTVEQSAEQLLGQARRFDPSTTLEELALARMIASEHDSGNLAEWHTLVDVALNRGPVLAQLTDRRGHFGRQGGGGRTASTRRDPVLAQLHAARSVLSGRHRGISRGAVRFFDARTQDRLYDRYKAGIKTGNRIITTSCDALTLLEVWSYDLRKSGRNRCPPDRIRRGPRPLAWVGEIPGVDAYRLLLMRPSIAGPAHDDTYGAARLMLLRNKKQPPSVTDAGGDGLSPTARTIAFETAVPTPSNNGFGIGGALVALAAAWILTE